MDTSEIYVKMCEAAKEIQEACPIDFKGYKPLFNGVTYDEGAGDVFYYRGERKVWLPRQDQLQEMIDCHKNIQIAHHRLYQIAEFWVGRNLNSFEQLWLAFVMYEKYEKKWDGEAWIKQ